MIVKILFTLLVIVIVALVFRNKSAKARPVTVETEDSRDGLSVKVVTYGIVLMLILVSSGIFAIKYQADNKIVTIRVIAKEGNITVYQARQKTIKGRKFTTLDEKQVTLGEGDRIEMEN